MRFDLTVSPRCWSKQRDFWSYFSLLLFFSVPKQPGLCFLFTPTSHALCTWMHLQCEISGVLVKREMISETVLCFFWFENAVKNCVCSIRCLWAVSRLDEHQSREDREEITRSYYDVRRHRAERADVDTASIWWVHESTGFTLNSHAASLNSLSKRASLVWL